MKVIQPNSQELRDLKTKAIQGFDRPLLAKIKELEGKEFVYCEEFYDVHIAATSIPDMVPVVVSTDLEKVFADLDSGEE